MTITTIEYALMAGAAYYDTRADENRVPYPASSGWERLPGFNHRGGNDDSSGFEAVAFINQAAHEVVIKIIENNWGQTTVFRAY
jgi:hypothetical protein